MRVHSVGLADVARALLQGEAKHSKRSSYMCGIVGYVGSNECGQLLIDGLRRLEYRGYDSAGLAILEDGQLVTRRAEGKLRNLEAAFKNEPVQGNLGIAHTRWATHGPPTERNAHPHRAGSVVIVHNGIIENHLELKQELISRGRVFQSDTDTEIVAHLIDEALSEGADSSIHPLFGAVKKALSHVEGSYALLAVSEAHPDVIVAGRNASPLVIGCGDGETFAASDIPAVLSSTRDFIFLEDGDLALLKSGGPEIYDVDGAKVGRASKRINWDPVSAEKQGFKHFMLKEIHEQSAKIADTMRGRVNLAAGDVDLRELNIDRDVAASINHIQILACGTSYHAGLVGRYLFEALARVRTTVDLASEFRYASPIVDGGTMALAISQSGETADTLAALKEAKRLGATATCICNVMESTIARESAGVFYTHAGPEIGVASTKAFTTQLVALTLMAIGLGRKRGVLTAEQGRHLLEEMRRIPLLVEGLVQDESAYQNLARRYAQAKSFLFLGRGVNFPIALEGALKLKEISYIHAEGYAAGEMKHGPIALIDEQMPVVVVATKGKNYEKVFSNLEETRARGGKVIAVATEGDTHIADYADEVLYIPDVVDELQPLLSVIPLQLLSYYIADFRGTDIDQPRNLAKSVTVE